ncbi:XRE family transcriptional regulator [Eubacterium sp. am_0171]|nr:helix-turn-helix domain-containing protein [Eubacterium sp. BIOML-A1]MSD05676.1 helix-turn-helix domain-containing protein [Eubacterium sp. BIOML-A2]RYT24570.1 XRE family transcriptional regulator [Eubacterium sp. am_0171]
MICLSMIKNLFDCVFCSDMLFLHRRKVNNMSFGNRLKEARKKARLTQQDMATRLKTTPQNYAQYERGVRKPKKETLAKISEVLGIGYTYAQNGEPYFHCFVDTVSNPKYAENESFNKRQYNDAMSCITDGKIVIPVRKQTPESITEREQEEKELDFINKMDKLGMKLNDSGQNKAIEQVELLTKIPEYQKDKE